MYRLLADGSFDTSFLGFDLYNAAVTSLLVQQDGRLLTSGFFTEVDGQPRAGIARLVAPQVLHVSNKQSAATLEAWPNPVADKH